MVQLIVSLHERSFTNGLGNVAGASLLGLLKAPEQIFTPRTLLRATVTQLLLQTAVRVLNYNLCSSDITLNSSLL